MTKTASSGCIILINGEKLSAIIQLGFQNVAVVRINGVVGLTRFSYKKMYGRFAETKKTVRKSEVMLLTS